MIHEPVNKWKDGVPSIVQVTAQALHAQPIPPTTEAPHLQHVAARTPTNALPHPQAEAVAIREHTRHLRAVVLQEVPRQVVPPTLLQVEVLPVLLQAADLRVAEAVVAAADNYKQYNHE